MTLLPNTTITFRKTFDLPGLDESLPAGAYDIGGFPRATEACAGARLDSAPLRLHPRLSHPGPERNLTVRQSDLKAAAVREATADASPGDRPLPDTLLDRMLADPMIRLVMVADKVSETEIRSMYQCRQVERSATRPDPKGKTALGYGPAAAVTGPRPGSPRPGIGE
jgi:hypothetical protein